MFGAVTPPPHHTDLRETIKRNDIARAEWSESKMNPMERRESPRRDAVYQIAFECFNARGEKVDAGPAHTVNISGRGALIEMPRGVDLDGSLILWIMGPFHTLLGKGSVVHSRSVANGAFHVGVRLQDIIEGSWEFWEKIARGRVEESEL
jgi:hypothetical protein